jgi:hypothetical protein
VPCDNVRAGFFDVDVLCGACPTVKEEFESGVRTITIWLYLVTQTSPLLQFEHGKPIDFTFTAQNNSISLHQNSIKKQTA